MKKIFGVIVAVSLCLCMLVPSAFAATSSIDEYLEGVDLSEFSVEELEALLADLDLGDLDVDSILAEYSVTDEEATDETDASEETDVPEATEENSSIIDLSWLTSILSMDTSSIETMFDDFEVSDLDSLLAVVSDAMEGAGVDLSAFDLSSVGSIDVSTLLASTTDSATATYTTTDVMAGLADTLLAGLESLGLDTTTIEALLDNEIVNFFANLYIGYVDGTVEEPTTTPEETTTVPAVVTTEVPKTGDTSAVVVAIATLSIASAAAFVCLKKKED